MKLIYYQVNKNFGDALNPAIFNKFLPDFFDNVEESVFIGIGSIIQFKFPKAKLKIVFSTGYAYGKVPELDKSYHISCVRGPLTAQKLGLDKKLGITDGAALLKMFDFPEEKKIYNCSFMPHHQSALFYDWQKICEEIGYNYIDPLADHNKIITQIRQSKVILAEAMHGAIVADTLRVPWIPLKLYPTINEFKWNDWTASLDLPYHPHLFNSLYSEKTINQKISNKFRGKLITNAASKAYQCYQDVWLNKDVLRKFSALQHEKPFISNEQLLDEKVEQLLEKLDALKFIRNDSLKVD